VLEFARDHALGLLAAAFMHAALIAALIVGLPEIERPVEPVARPPVQAVAVSEADLRAAEQRRDAALAAEQRRREEAERQRQEEARRAAEAERERQAQLQREREQQAAEAKAAAEREAREREAVAAAERAAEAKRAEEARQAEAARKAEQARKEAEARAKAEAEARAKAEAEARRKAEEAARAEAARKAEEARIQAQRQQELAAQIEAEQRRMALQQSSEYGLWLGAIQDQVARNWNRPPSARPGLDCEVRVQLIPGMQVVNTEIVRCNGDEAVRRSIVAAVERASPLPRPPDPALFERTIVFDFKPED